MFRMFAPACGLSMSDPFSEQIVVVPVVQLSYEYSQSSASPQDMFGSHLITVWSWVGRVRVTIGTTGDVRPFMSVPEMKVAPVNALKMFVARLYEAEVRFTMMLVREPTARWAMMIQSEWPASPATAVVEAKVREVVAEEV